ncbi:hypothetical protein [Avibacterium volantium]|uniref:hypothetical protein n=1 Tax=Avibacterium TaxID=292486 RepID=UPI003BF77AC2
MNKKVKIIGILSVITASLALGAQFYTNHKIDQLLQQFPYQLSDQISLNVAEQDKNFFTRQLIFSLTDEKSAKSSQIIATKITALPFAVLADSELVAEFVRELNKNFKVTIDKNNITSKFSVIGDYSQTNIHTQFRDLTNKAQDLNIDLNFISKNKYMEVQTQLSGFNYDHNSKLEQLDLNATLIPLNESKYDLESLSVKLKDSTIYLLNGENTTIKLNGLDYNFNKSLLTNAYSLKTKIKANAFSIFNKNNKEQSINLNDVDFSISQNEIPAGISYSQLLALLQNDEKIDYAKLLDLAIDLLTKNKDISLDFSVGKTTIPFKKAVKPLTIDKLALDFNGDLADINNASFKTSLAVGEIKNEEKNREFEMKGTHFKQSIQGFDLATRLFLLRTLIIDLIEERETLDKKAMMEKIEYLANHYQQNSETDFSVQSISGLDNVYLKNLVIKSKDEFDKNDSYQGNYGISLEEYLNKSGDFKLTNLKFDLPIKLENVSSVIPVYLCTQTVFCAIYSDKDATDVTNKWIKNAVIKTDLTINNGLLQGIISTSSNDYSMPFNISLDLSSKKLSSANSKESIELLWQQKNAFTDLNINLSLGNRLFKDNSIWPIYAEKSADWSLLINSVKPDGELNPYLVENGEIYEFHLQKTGESLLINGTEISQPKAE